MPVVIRIPLIPGVNDTKKDLTSIVEIVSSLKARRVDLLPYHKFGMGKYAQLDRTYELEALNTQPEEQVKQYREVFTFLGFDCDIVG